jgi:hypothetical protein
MLLMMNRQSVACCRNAVGGVIPAGDVTYQGVPFFQSQCGAIGRFYRAASDSERSATQDTNRC